jgi:hypothetical protein
MRDRNWIETTIITTGVRQQIDANAIEGEPEDKRARHTPPMDRSGELWMPGFHRVERG